MLRLLEQYEHQEASSDTLPDEDLALEACRARAAVFAETLLSDPGAAGLVAEKCGYALSIAKQLG
ncbi:hypothetical protein CA85_40780 [Allorhodopirellula solitaria]|uniref:Uncharacterized protein n=2 Tax=Allorhodopirellula solitaria TaxID=2527987 RepID=A0A5C5X2Z6_9BACT|nr:hypothetical protein CA85_40780 [Allorhodopirellula solitaria]